MFRKLCLSLTAVLLFAAAGPGQSAKKTALDKATLEAYVRHLFVLDSRISLQVSDPKPSASLPGFLDVTVHAWAGKQSQDFLFMVSKDGSKIVQGNVYDISQNPFKPELEKLKTEFAPSMGTAGAPVVLVEFSDFECPYCKQEATMLRQNLLSAYPKQVRLYFKEFPLESIHPWSRAGAIAGRCVYQQNANSFWDYHDWAFEHQAEITPENFNDKVMQWAKGQKTLDVLQLGNCLGTKATAAEVDKTIAEGHALQINGTPTLFVNGRRIPNLVDWATLRNIIDYEIEYQKTAKNAGEDCGCDMKLSVPGLDTQKTSPMFPPKK
ncbi:MAG TPA: thioredoxin domain-containing protein [Bryobacteraceae bacterium]|nr:thioredoxin domain-containing protein [Bryobacteraceae bacterium]